MKKAIIVLALAVVLAGAVVWWLSRESTVHLPATPVSTFEECVAAGNPVLESHPRRCQASAGQTFTEDLGGEQELADRIRVSSPRPNASVRSPQIIEGEAVGNWYFEASFPLRIVDGNGFTLALLPVAAQGEWMTESFVPFRAEAVFARPSTDVGRIEFRKDNPSGLPEHDAVLVLPVRFSEGPTANGPTMTTTIFLSDERAAQEPPYDCARTVAVERVVPKTEQVAGAALAALLRGTSEADVPAGRSTNLPPGVELNSLSIDNGLATADFSEQLEYQVAGSCRVTAIRAQIADTLLQFESVTDVLLSINGRVDGVLQP